MILMSSEAACGHCPNALICMTRRKLAHVTFCRRCGCVTFKHAGQRYLCALLREGVHSRIEGPNDAVERSWVTLSDRDRRVARVLQAVLSKRAEYSGCVRGASQRRSRTLWRDCVEYFRAITNEFDAEL